MFLRRKIDKTETDSKQRPFFTLEKIFPLSTFDCGCMTPPLSKILGTPLTVGQTFKRAQFLRPNPIRAQKGKPEPGPNPNITIKFISSPNRARLF